MSTTYFDDLVIERGATDLAPTRPIQLRGRDYYCLQYNHAGTITVWIDDHPPRLVHGPSLLLTLPGHSYEFGNREGWHHNYLAFRGERVHRYIDTGLLPTQDPLIRIRDSRVFLDKLRTCIEAIGDRTTSYACHLFEGVLLELHRDVPQTTDLASHELVRSLVEHMRAAPNREWDLNTQARCLHLSLAHLRRLFKQITGLAPGRFLLQCRLAVAADRLTGTLDPIKQIAEDCGLGNVHYFSRMFRRHYDCPPGRFRREFLGG